MNRTWQAWLKSVAALGVVLIVGAAASTVMAASVDVTDLWWNDAEPGWAMQVTQDGDQAIATLLVYDPAGEPAWYLGVLDFEGFPYDDPDDYAHWSGMLYETRGSWFGGRFDPAQVQATAVGEIRFRHGSTAGVLDYRIGNSTVSKPLRRQTLATEDLSGSYAGVYQAYTPASNGCPRPGDDQRIVSPATFTIDRSASEISIVVAIGDGPGAATCTFTGPYAQVGRLGSVGRLPGACSDGAPTKIEFTDIVNSPVGLTARFGGSDRKGCLVFGRLVGLRAPGS